MTSSPFSDDAHVERIAQALWSREPSGTASVLVGAGFSRNAVAARATAGMMPGWNDIYTEMVGQLYPAGHPDADDTREWLLKQTGATSAYLRVAEEYEAQFRRDGLDKLILRHVPDQQFEPGELHRQLLQLPWADVLTTNWDTLLERAAEDVEDRVYDVVRMPEEIPEARAPRIVKLHGSFPSSRPFIFTEEDFRTYPTRFAPFVNLAQQLAMENTLVLLGFSGDDPNFLYWSGWVRDRLGPKAPMIYLVGALNLSSSKRRMLENRGVQPVDLARLADFQHWPETLRVQNGNQWFLERLRASEPYPARRWPRPQAGTVPPLAFVTTIPDPSAPPAYDDGINGDATIKLNRLVEHSRRTRLVYPGWVVPPLETANYVWSGLRNRLPQAAPAIAGLPPEERLDALYEIDWQLQVSLVPLSLIFQDEVTCLLDELKPGFEALDGSQAIKFRALALSVVRHAREVNDEALFARWVTWLTPQVEHRSDERDHLTYERCLRHRANLEFAELEAVVLAWAIDADPYWNVRRAGLLSELGRHKEADDLSAQALNEIRRRTARGVKDISSWSRESYALLLRSTFLFGDFGSWSAHKAIRDRFDQRQELLAARGCTGRQDFFQLIESLNQVPPPFENAIERKTRFDIGSSSIKMRFAGSSDAERRLLAYRAMRFLDDTGLPSKIDNVRVGAPILQHAARWLIEVEPNAAVDALMRGSERPGADAFEEVFSRSTVASTDADKADRLIGKLLRLADLANTRCDASGGNRLFWLDRLKVAVELISRFVLRAPLRAPIALELGLRLQASPWLIHGTGIPEQISKLIVRAVEALPQSDESPELLSLFKKTIPDDPDQNGEIFDAASAVTSLGKDIESTSEWAEAIDLALDAAACKDTRRNATRRLAVMREANLLNDAQEKRLGAVLWAPDNLVDGLPGDTIWLPVAFLELPAPDAVDVRGAIASAILAGELDDGKVLSGAISSLLASERFPLEECELLEQFARLRRFTRGHAPAPSHPDLLGDRREDLVKQTSSIFANLVRKSGEIEATRSAIDELAQLERHPLRLEPAIPALVSINLLDRETGQMRLRALLGSDKEIDGELLEFALIEMVRISWIDPDFEQAMWSEVKTNLVARRPGFIAGCLGFLIVAFQRDPSRVPTSIDLEVSAALDLIREETAPCYSSANLLYEPFLVRFRAAILAAQLRSAGRGVKAVIDAWERAAAEDPLPDVRRAWQTGLRMP